jgi:hypothetical protein
MILSRRQFFEVSAKGTLGTAILAAEVGGAAYLLSGCSFNISSILAWVPTATSSISSILTLLVGAGALACLTCSVLANIALAAISAVGTAVQAYQNAPAASKATLLGKIQTGLQAALTASGSFFESANVPDQKLFALIVGIAGLVLSAISGFIAQVGGVTPVPATFRLSRQTIPYSPKVYTLRGYKSDFNKLVKSYDHAELAMS